MRFDPPSRSDALRIRRGVVGALRRAQPPALDAAGVPVGVGAARATSLGDLRVRELTPLTIARFRTSSRRTASAPSRSARRSRWSGACCSRAVEWQLLDVNPVHAARKPPRRRASCGCRRSGRRWSGAIARLVLLLRRPATGRGARAGVASRPRAHAGRRAGGRGRARERAQEPPPPARRPAPRARSETISSPRARASAPSLRAPTADSGVRPIGATGAGGVPAGRRGRSGCGRTAL